MLSATTPLKKAKDVMDFARSLKEMPKALTQSGGSDGVGTRAHHRHGIFPVFVCFCALFLLVFGGATTSAQTGTSNTARALEVTNLPLSVPVRRPEARPRRVADAPMRLRPPPRRPSLAPDPLIIDATIALPVEDTLSRPLVWTIPVRRPLQPYPLTVTRSPDILAMFRVVALNRQAKGKAAAQTQASAPDAVLPRPAAREVQPLLDGDRWVQTAAASQRATPGSKNSLAVEIPEGIRAAPQRSEPSRGILAMTPEESIDAIWTRRVALITSASTQPAQSVPNVAPQQTPIPPQASDPVVPPSPDAASEPLTETAIVTEDTDASADAPPAIPQIADVTPDDIAALPMTTAALIVAEEPFLLPRPPVRDIKKARAAIKALNDTPQIVALVERPVLRPASLKRQAARILANRNSVAAKVAKKQAPKAATPSASLKLPTKASVARAATIKDGISLGEVSLIGIFGKSSSRRALVRTPDGDVVRVKTGDRVRGWSVAAIGKSAVRMARSGKTRTLRLPN